MGHVLRLSVVTIALAAGAVAGPAVIAQKPDTLPLPSEELFVQQPGLKVSLVLGDPTLHVGQDPLFKLRFENAGSTRLYVNPHVESNLFITRSNGEPVPPAHSGVGERPLFAINASQLIPLDPRGRWETPVTPGHHGEDLSSFRDYAQHGYTKDSGWALLLPPGEYVARFLYINAPGYGAAYDVNEMPAGVWEGRLDTPPVPFTVVAPTSEQLARDVLRIRNPTSPELRSLLPLLALSPADLIAQFVTDPATGVHTFQAARMHPQPVTHRLLEAIDRLTSPERESVIYSGGLSLLIRERADCRVLTFLAGELASSRGDVLSNFRPVFETSAAQCPEVRLRLRDMINDERLSPFARGNAAALLGSFGDPGDVPLLVAALERKLPATPGPSRPQEDPIARGAVAGLAMIGGATAREALARALADEGRNYSVGLDVVSRLASFGGDEVVGPLIGALSSSHPQIVTGAIGALGQLRAPAAAPRLAELLKHRNPTIRSAAARALWAVGDPEFADAMRNALTDVDENVQTTALFYLAERGQPSDLDLFLSRMDSRNQYVREAARAGVSRFGTAASFTQLRKVLDHEALRRLTFMDYGPNWTPQRWDAWYARHRGTTRVDWAREALEEESKGGSSERRPAGSLAISYLADQGAAKFRQDFERAAASRHSGLRVAAARALARVDRTRAAKLLVREFDSRLPGACYSANDALNELAGTKRKVDCTDPAARQRAKTDWAQEGADDRS